MTITTSASPSTESKLKAGAAATGLDVTRYTAELIEQMVSDKPGAAGALSPEQRAAEWRAWTESHPRIDHIVDDSRESVYAGRGE
jgi:hypothetical protein